MNTAVNTEIEATDILKWHKLGSDRRMDVAKISNLVLLFTGSQKYNLVNQKLYTQI
jgi:hypothetical protein